MYCKKCGAQIEEDLCCKLCGFQNIIEETINEPMVETIEVAETDNGLSSQPLVLESVKVKSEIIRNKAWVVVSGIMFVLSLIPFYKGYDKMTNYYSSDIYYSLNKNAYVGGDAYNYIINAGYATAFFVLAVGLAIMGVGFLIIYYISGKKVEINI